MAVNVKQPEINLPVNSEDENKEKVETPVILRFNQNGEQARDRWVFDGSASIEKQKKDFENYIDDLVINGKEIPKSIEDFNSYDSVKNLSRGNADKAKSYYKMYAENLERYGVKSYEELNAKIKNGEALKKIQKAGTDTKKQEQANEIVRTGSTPAETTVKKTVNGENEVVPANPLATEEERIEAAETAQELTEEKKEEKQPKVEMAQIAEEDIKPIKDVFDTFETYGINVATDDFTSLDSETKLQDVYNSMSPEERREFDKQISTLAPTIQKAWKDVKDKNSSKLKKFFNKFVERCYSDPDKREEWLRANPTPITAIFGDSGLNAGQRIGLALGLLSAISSDALLGYNAGLNHSTSTPKATENFLYPFKKINEKNIERITKLKDASTNAEGEMEGTIANYKQDNRLKALPRDLLASLVSFLQNPDNQINEETLKEYEDEFQKAYENFYGVNLSSDLLPDYNKWKATTLKHLASKVGIDKERLDNANKFLDLSIKENSLAQQIHNFEFSSINDYTTAIQGLRNEERELVKMRADISSASDTKKLLEIAGSYRNVVSGLSTTSEGSTETSSSGNTEGSNISAGGSASGDAGVKAIAKIQASAHVDYGKSKTNTETSGRNKNTAVYQDAANDEVYKWLNNDEIKGELNSAKETLLKAIDAQIEAVNSAIKELEAMKSKRSVSFDNQLNNLYETGFYAAPKIKNNDYYRYRLGLV